MDRDQTNDDDHRHGGDHDHPVDGSSPIVTEQVATDRDGDLLTTTAGHDPDDAHLTRAEVGRLRTVLNDGSLEDHTSRIKWFLIGFLFALLALAVAALAFLVVSDEDDDGEVDLQVPTLDVDVDG